MKRTILLISIGLLALFAETRNKHQINVVNLFIGSGYKGYNFP